MIEVLGDDLVLALDVAEVGQIRRRRHARLRIEEPPDRILVEAGKLGQFPETLRVHEVALEYPLAFLDGPCVHVGEERPDIDIPHRGLLACGHLEIVFPRRLSLFSLALLPTLPYAIPRYRAFRDTGPQLAGILDLVALDGVIAGFRELILDGLFH